MEEGRESGMNDIFYRVRTPEEQAKGVFPMMSSLREKLKESCKRVDVPEEQTRLLTHVALFDKRKFVIEKIKKPLMLVIILVAKRLFNVTRENCAQKNTKVIFDIEELFFKYEDNAGRKQLFEAAFKIFKFEYEHDPYYRYRFDWMLEELIKAVNDGRWQPRPEGEPSFCWKEPGERKARHWYTL